MVSTFEPLTIGSIEIANRIAVPAMVTRLSDSDGLVNPGIIDRYTRFCEGGAGMVVVEAASIHGGRSGPLLKISDDSFIPGLSKLTAACHQAGESKVFLQIIHFLKVARSGWRQKVSDLSIEELEALPDLFADAAERVQKAGFDGVELHMAHAYTMSSMLSRHNKRPDHYGRTLENRLRLPSMVLSRVRERLGEFPVGVRFNADESIKRGYSVGDSGQIAIRLAELGADYISLSSGGKFEDAVHREGQPLYPYTGYSGDRCMPGDNLPDAANIWMAESVRSTLRSAGHHTPILGTGKIGTVALADEVLGRGSCDIVGMARALLADPYLPNKSKAGDLDQVVSCIYCNVCKSLDERFKTVICYLWPSGATQAPRPGEFDTPTMSWPEEEPLSVSTRPGEVRLVWTPAGGEVAGYDVLRSVDGEPFVRITACTRTRQLDNGALSGTELRYQVVPYAANGAKGPASNVVETALD